MVVELTTSRISININYGHTLINDKVKCIGNIFDRNRFVYFFKTYIKDN